MTKAGANGSQVKYGTPARGKDAGSRAVPGRRCAHAGCLTVLTTYNPGTTCWLHTDTRYVHPLT